MKRITYSEDALRTLRRMPANVSALIRSKIEQYAADPASLAANVRALKGEPACFACGSAIGACSSAKTARSSPS